VPAMDEWEVFLKEAVAVGMKAIEQGVARISVNRNELYQKVFSIIKRARDSVKLLMEKEIIPPAPGS